MNSTFGILGLKAFDFPIAYGWLPELDRLLKHPDQDPEWVSYVWTELQNLTSHEDRLRFLEIERACAERRLIQKHVSTFIQSYGYRVPQESINSSVMEILERNNVEFDRNQLRGIVDSLKEFGAPFFQTILTENEDYLNQMHRLEVLRRQSHN